MLAAVVVAGVVTAATLTASATRRAGSLPRRADHGAPAAADPDSPQARYVDRLCASGTLLTTLGSTAISPTPGDDVHGERKRDYLAVRRPHDRHRVQARAPRCTAPCSGDGPRRRTGRSRPSCGLIVSEFTKARDAFTAGRAPSRWP